MNPAPAHDALGRLERLGRYLEEDPGNPALLADAFDTALACGELDCAHGAIAAAQRHALAPAEWTFREARLCIARKDLPRAAALLEQLRGSAGDNPVLAHDLAYVRLLQGDFAACRALLQPWIGPDRKTDAPMLAPAVQQALQVLWLRAAHRLGLLAQAWDWLEAEDAGGRLQPAARGVASLIAVDRGDFERARVLADAGLAADGRQVEALVARATVALALGDSPQADALLQRALDCNPADGRIWSALGFASLQARRLGPAQQQLERAVQELPGHIGSWHALGWTRLLQGDRPGARAAFEQALALDRNFAESHGALGLVLALAGEEDQARHHLDLADRLDRRNLTGAYARALLSGEAGDPARLHQLASRLLDRPGFFGGKLSDALNAAGRKR